MRVHYTDFVTERRTFTVGVPVRVERGGPLGVRYLVVRRKNDELLIPEYSLRGVSRKLLREVGRTP